jgi:signal transduction histidine kinase
MSTAAAPAAGSRRSREFRAREIDPLGMKVLSGFLLILTGGGIAMAFALREGPWVSNTVIVLWALLVAAAEMAPMSSGRGAPWLSLDLPILLGAAFVLGPGPSGVIAFLGSLDVHEFKREVSLPRALYNRSQTSLSVMAAAVAFGLLGGRMGHWPWTAVAGLLALCVDCLVNYSLVAIATALVTRCRVKAVLAKMTFGSADAFVPTYASFGFLGILLAEAYVAVGFWGVVAFAGPLLLARSAFLHRHGLESAYRSLKARSQALQRVDERIAAERKDERSRIAEALHDEVLQNLYNVSIRTHVLREDLRSGSLLNLDDDIPALLLASEHAIQELRDVIRDLRKSTIGHAGLVDTLGLLINHLRDESGMRFVTKIDLVSAEASAELLIYQIAREALVNAVRHSRAQAVWISLNETEGRIELRIEDDGIGFDPRDPDLDKDSRHFGVELMKERAAQLGAEFTLAASPGGGVVVDLAVPRQTGVSAPGNA